MNILHKSLVVLTLTVAMSSCKREHKDGEVVGLKNIAASSNFQILPTDPFKMVNPSPDVHLTNTTPNFSAKFNETVSWKIVLTGLNSTATKTLLGTSSVIDVTNSSWIGNHDSLYYFEDKDTIKADLIISGKEGIYSSVKFLLAEAAPIVSTATFQLAQTKGAGTVSGSATDFEGKITYPYMLDVGPNPNKPTSTIIMQTDLIKAPQGKKYLHIEGLSIEQNGFFVGGTQCRMDATATGRFLLDSTWTDPTKLYVNIYVRGMDNLPLNNKPYATLNYECHEDDNDNLSTTANCTYYMNKPAGTKTDCFCPSSEDAWVFKIPITHIGWKLFSCRYSDLMPSEDFANGGFGNHKLEPEKICRVQFGLVSSPPFNLVSADVDFACFTYGAPLDPTK